MYCWVSSACPDAEESDAHPGWFFARTDVGYDRTRLNICFNDILCSPQCSTFSLSRVCSAPQRVCPTGWKEHHFRCYKYFPSSDKYNATLSWTDASSVCSDAGGSLTSIATAEENSFLAQLALDSIEYNATANKTEINVTGVWVGLTADVLVRQNSSDVGFDNFQVWSDGSPIVFNNLTNGVNQQLNQSAVVLIPLSGEWKALPQDINLPFICEKSLLATVPTCECSNVSDAHGYGASCNHWTPDEEPWCYTSSSCPQAAPSQTGMWYRYCYGISTSTKTSTVTTTTSSTATVSCLTSEYKNLTKEYGATCVPLSFCDSGEYVSTEPTVTSDLECSTCPRDSYQNITEHQQRNCKPQPLCNMGTYFEYQGKLHVNYIYIFHFFIKLIRF